MTVDPMTASPWVSYEIFSYLNTQDLATCTLVSKKWHQYTSNDFLWRNAIYRKVKEQCETTFGKIELFLPPLNIREMLNSPCPIWPGKKVYQTHILKFIPKTINKKPLTLGHLSELAWRYFRPNPIGGNRLIKESCWVLMTRDVVPGSRNKAYIVQKAIAKRFSKMAYQIPSTIEASFCILMHYFNTGKRIFSDNPLTYTFCEDINYGWQWSVGRFNSHGLDVEFYSVSDDWLGLALIRKLATE